MKKLKRNKTRKKCEIDWSVLETVDDVISHVLWNDGMDLDDIRVGYLDVAHACQENYFTSLSLMENPSVYSDVEQMIVSHRMIQYFKYKDEKVWFQDVLLDAVIESTITPLLDESRENHTDECEANDRDVKGELSEERRLEKHIPEAGRDIGNISDFYYNKVLEYWDDKTKPNYFLVLKVENVMELQNYILKQEPRYAECCLSPTLLHVNLCTMGLDSPDDVNKMKRILLQMQPDLKEIISKSSWLRFKGVSNFSNRILYLKAEYPPEFAKLVQHIKCRLLAEDIQIRDNKPFQPHLTILKISRKVSRHLCCRNVDQWLCVGFHEMEFGSHDITEIRLCSMGKDRGDDDFYPTVTSIPL